jgi:hypothetical protein
MLFTEANSYNQLTEEFGDETECIDAQLGDIRG